MQAYEGYFENGRFYLSGETSYMNIKGCKRAFITILDEPVGKKRTNEDKNKKKPRSASRGVFKGKIHMSSDFDEPLEEMKEYME